MDGLMFKNVSIKKLLYAVPVVLVLSLTALYLFLISSLGNLENRSLKASLSNKIIKEILQTRISEKNYKRRREVKFIQEVQSGTEDLLVTAKRLKGMFQDSHNVGLTTEIIESTQQYALLFHKYQKRREASLKMQKVMVQKAQSVENITLKIRAIQKRKRDAIIATSKNPRMIKDAVEKASIANRILKELADIRIAEKNFIIRKDKSYMDEIKQSIAVINQLSKESKEILNSQKTKRMVDNATEDLVSYHQAISKYDALREESYQISDKMKDFARKDEDIATILREEQKEQKIELSKELETDTIIAFVVISILLILIILFVSRVILKNLSVIDESVYDIYDSATGKADLTKQIVIEENNEIAVVARGINVFIKKVQDLISNAKETSSEATSISNELSRTANEIGHHIETEAKLVNSTTEDIQKMTTEAQVADDKANEMYKILENSSSSLDNTIQKIKNMVEIVKESSVKEEDLALKMGELRNSTDDVKSILELIGDIAEQTNLLSLNAAIEAARAGEHGRGFAVVADEVRKLAERTQKSLTEINATINVVVQAVDESSEGMQENAKDIAVAAEQAGDVEISIDEVKIEVENSKEMANESSQSAKKLKDEVVKLSDKMLQLNKTATLNARNTEEVAAASNRQNSVIEELNQQLMSFKS